MDRRRFLVTLLAGAPAPLGAGAQQLGTTRRIGVLAPGTDTPGGLPTIVVEAFRQGLRDLGYIERRDLVLDVRWDEGKPERNQELARELVRLPVHVIVAGTTPSTIAAQKATTTVPIVMAATGGDPVSLGLVTSVSRPGGNVTGLILQTHELPGKRLEFVKEVVPKLLRIALFWHPGHPSAGEIKGYETAARNQGVELQRIEARGPEQFDAAFEVAARAGSQAAIFVQSAVYAGYRARLAEIALKRQIPTISGETGFAAAGGLMNYGPNIPDSWRRAAGYVDKILKGAKPGDLPLEQPTKFELIINLKTAKALGLTIPPSLLARADQVIE
jgi:putative ABC transport system substrate-binding protein